MENEFGLVCFDEEGGMFYAPSEKDIVQGLLSEGDIYFVPLETPNGQILSKLVEESISALSLKELMEEKAEIDIYDIFEDYILQSDYEFTGWCFHEKCKAKVDGFIYYQDIGEIERVQNGADIVMNDCTIYPYWDGANSKYRHVENYENLELVKSYPYLSQETGQNSIPHTNISLYHVKTLTGKEFFMLDNGGEYGGETFVYKDEVDIESEEFIEKPVSYVYEHFA